MKLPKPGEGGTYENPPPGTYVGICIGFLDLGTHAREYKGERKIGHEVRITWELIDELMSDGRPFVVSKYFRWSMHEKSNLRKDLESWRGKAFEAKDFEGDTAFNTRKLLGQPAMIGIVEYTKANGEKSTKVDSVSKPLKGLTPAKPVNPLVYFSLDPEDFDQATYDGLSDGLKDMISKSPEYVALHKGATTQSASAHNGLNAGFDPDDQIPF